MKPVDARLLRLARAARLHLGVTAVLGVVAALLTLANAELLSRGIADVVDRGFDHSRLAVILLALGLVVVGRAVVVAISDAAAQRASAAVKSSLRRRLVDHVSRLGPDAQVARSEVVTLSTRGLDALDGYFGSYLPQLVLALVVPFLVLARMFPADLTSAITVLLTLPLIPIFMILIGRATETANAKRWDALARLAHHFLDVVSGLTTLRVFGRAKHQAVTVREATDRYRTTTMATLRIAFLSSLALELIATLSVAIVAVGVGLRLVRGEGIDLQTGLLVIILAPEAYLPLRNVGARYHAAAEGLAAVDVAFGLLDQPAPALGPSTSLPDLREGGSIVVSEVSVSHPGRSGFAPDGVSFTARHGALTVITGESGAGKTTMLSVLLGARRPDHGGVEIVGADVSAPLADLDLDLWRTQLAWLDQNPAMIAGSIAHNVRLGRRDATDDEVSAALEAVGLGDLDARRDVGERGSGLSAGQRRRLGLARVIVRGAPIVLLDEPTAGLDADSESAIMATIVDLAATRIVVMVSHRPAAIAAAAVVVAVRSTDRVDPSADQSVEVPA